MPLRSERPIVRVEPGSMHTIETRNVENLFGLWSVFSKCSPAMEDGTRYENMAWRLWSRETFCCAPDHIVPPRWSFQRQLSSSGDVPELSTSVASDDSQVDSAIASTSRSNSSSSRPGFRRTDSTDSRARGKHITPIDLEKVVNSIQEKRDIEPLSPLPPQLSQTLPIHTKSIMEDTTPQPSSPPPTKTPARYVPESSTSTVATTSCADDMSPPVGSDSSTSTELSQHSVVHGFEPGRVSTSMRSSTNLAPTPILKTGFHTGIKPEPTQAGATKKKQPIFMLGGSSDEDNASSFENSMYKRSSLSEGLRKPGLKKTTSFKDTVTTRTIPDTISSEESEEAIESDSEDESDNAIEEDDSEDDWEDDNDDSGPSSMTEREMFHKVDSKPNLVSRRSLLTTLMHEGDRASALQNLASRSSPAIRRSRTTTPNGPSTGTSPQDEGLMMRQQATRAKPIIMTTSNVHPPALSPRTTRRNMLQTELTQSLRQNLLWERQQKNATTNAVNKRHQSSASIPALRRAATTNDIKGMHAPGQQLAMQKASTFKDPTKNNNSFNDYFDQGLQEYHQKGW